MLISINSTVLKPLEEKSWISKWRGCLALTLRSWQKEERHLSEGTVQTRAEDSGRRWHRAGIEYDGRLAPGSVMTQTAWLLIFGVTEGKVSKSKRNASGLYQDVFIFYFCGFSSDGFILDKQPKESFQEIFVAGLSTIHHEKGDASKKKKKKNKERKKEEEETNSDLVEGL